jgi:hypothetical protein
MATWVTITGADILSRLSSPEYNGVNSYDLASGQSDPIDAGIALALAEVRGYIPESERDSDETLIPPELKDTTIVIAIEKVAGRLSSADIVMTESRRQAYEIAIQRLRDTARGYYHISSQSGGLTSTSSTDGETLTGGNEALCYGGEAKLDF